MTLPNDPSKGYPTPKVKGPKLAKSHLDPVISIKSPTKFIGGFSYSDLLPFLPFDRHIDRDKDGRDEGCGEEVRGPPFLHTGENTTTHFVCLWPLLSWGFR
jgi:hypothetical protein